jgi:hypothetical protein
MLGFRVLRIGQGIGRGRLLRLRTRGFGLLRRIIFI